MGKIHEKKEHDGYRVGMHKTAPRIAFTRRQLEDIQKFKADLKEGKVEFVFKGTMLAGLVFLVGGKNITECFHR